MDGAGNASKKATAVGPAAKLSVVYDDAPGCGIKLTGDWKTQTDLQPAHAGTISLSKEKGATAEVTFEGRTVLWFSKLGDNCGKAAVSIDGGRAEIVDIYSADDIWGICVYRKKFSEAGRHTLRIEVLGQHGMRAKDTVVYIDGVRVEQ